MSSTVPEKYRDLLQLPFAVLATNGPNGYPQLSEVVFFHDPEDELVRLSLNDSRQKMKNLRRDPRATLFINDPTTPLRTLEIRADVEIRPDEDFSFAAAAGALFSKKLGLPDDQAVDFHGHDQPGETRSILTLHPRRIVGAALAMDDSGNVLLTPPVAERDFTVA